MGIICTRGAKRLRPARDLCDESKQHYLATLVLGESNKSPTLGLKDVCVYLASAPCNRGLGPLVGLLYRPASCSQEWTLTLTEMWYDLLE